MGMFDYVNFETKCPVCGNILKGFQTKDAGNDLECVEFWEVDKFYDSCEICGTWVEFNLKEEVRKRFTIEDYDLSYRKGRGEQERNG